MSARAPLSERALLAFVAASLVFAPVLGAIVMWLSHAWRACR